MSRNRGRFDIRGVPIDEHGFPCPHCGKPEPTPPPAPFRRALVLLVGLGVLTVWGLTILLLISVLFALADPLIAISAVLGLWGLVYCTYLWLSFFLIGSFRIPGCEFTALDHVLRGKRTHRCVDSVLNSVLDEKEGAGGKLIALLKTESAQKWTIGLALLVGFIVFLTFALVMAPFPGLVSVGIFAIIYLAYDRTIHRVSIGRKWLTGSGDYRRILSRFLRGKFD
jgi:hypothetical protein